MRADGTWGTGSGAEHAGTARAGVGSGLQAERYWTLCLLRSAGYPGARYGPREAQSPHSRQLSTRASFSCHSEVRNPSLGGRWTAGRSAPPS